MHDYAVVFPYPCSPHPAALFRDFFVADFLSSSPLAIAPRIAVRLLVTALVSAANLNVTSIFYLTLWFVVFIIKP